MKISELLPKKKVTPYNASQGIKYTDAGYNLALSEISQLLDRLQEEGKVCVVPSKEEFADFLYKTIYVDKNPQQEISARLECLVLAQTIIDLLKGK